jgi:hypothetical protein
MKTATAMELRALAAWYRDYAKRAGNPTIWDARLRTAEDLEAEAARLDAAAVQTSRQTEAPQWQAVIREVP